MPLVKRGEQAFDITVGQHDGNMTQLEGYQDVAELLASTDGYTPTGLYAAGDVIRTRDEGFSYLVASSVVTDHHLVTAAGVKLYVLPQGDVFNLFAFGPNADDTTSDLAIIENAVKVAAGRTLLIPEALYYLDGTFNLVRKLNIVAEPGATFRFPAGTHGMIAQVQGDTWGTTGATGYARRVQTATSLLTYQTGLVKYDGDIYGPVPGASTTALVTNQPDVSPTVWRLIRVVDGGDGTVPTWIASQPAGTYPSVGSNMLSENYHYFLEGMYVQCKTDNAWYLVLDPDEVSPEFTTRYGIKLATAAEPANGHAIGSIISDLTLNGTDPTHATEAYGFWRRATCYTNRLTVRNFSRDGMRTFGAVVGEANLSPQAWGNVNTSRDTYPICENNGHTGWGARGSDANVCSVIGGISRYNGKHGFEDGSFLGNTLTACRSIGNGTKLAPANAALGGSMVTHLGKRWRAVYVEGLLFEPSQAQLDLLVVTEPGDDEDVWEDLLDDGDPDTLHPAWQSGQASGYYFPGGGFKCMNSNARTLVEGCHSDPQEAGNLFIGTYIANIGGNQPRIARGGHLTAQNGNILTSTGLEVSIKPTGGIIHELTLAGATASGGTILMTFEVPSQGDPINLTWTPNGNLKCDVNGSSTVYEITGPATDYTMGTGVPQPFVFNTPTLAIGLTTNARRHRMGTAAPTTGESARGDIMFNRDPSAGGFAGWICTTAGTPGTWKTFGAIPT